MNTKGESSSEYLENLRKKAEAIQKKITEQEFEQLADADTRKLFQELSLYQIELEMQNEQLRMVTQELSMAVLKYEELYDFAPVGYLTIDPYGLVLETNLTCTRLLGTNRRQLVGSRLSRLVAPEDFNTFTAYLSSLNQSGTKHTCELTFIRPDKTFFEARLEGIAFVLENAQNTQLRIALTDISEQKAAERQKRESQEFVQKIAETLPDMLTIYDLEKVGNIYSNRSVGSLLGISPGKVRSTPWLELLQLVHPDDKAGFQQYMTGTRNLRDGEVSEFEYRIKNTGGGWSWLRVRTVAFSRNRHGQVNQILSVQQDVTFKKQAEEELRFKNQIIDGLQSNLPIVISLIRPNGTFETMTGSGLASVRKAGFENLQGQNIFEQFPDLRPVIETVFRTGEKVSYVYCIGPDTEVCFRNYVFLDSAQNAAVSFSIDISEQMAAERIILAEREFSQSLLDNNVDGILAVDPEGSLTAWNSVLEQTTGMKKEDVLGMHLAEVFPDFRKQKQAKALKELLKGNSQVIYGQDFGIKGTDFEVYLNPLRDSAGRIIGGLCILHNVVEQKKLEAEATQLKLNQQKAVLNAILTTQEEERKRIAESLHNGLGQLLYAAKLNQERNKFTDPEGQKLQMDLLDEAIRETRSISFDLVPGILEDFGLETALEELVSRISKSGLNLKFYASGLERYKPEIEVAAYRIIQELINNTIKHARATMVSLEVLREQNKLLLTAKDNGVGFDPAEVARLHKGIGLTGIQNRVKLLDGKLSIQSKKGKGTTVAVELQLN